MVQYAGIIDVTNRIVSISHTLSCDAGHKWIVTYEFEPTGAIAAPQSTPAPTSPNPSTLPRELGAPLQLVNSAQTRP